MHAALSFLSLTPASGTHAGVVEQISCQETGALSPSGNPGRRVQIRVHTNHTDDMLEVRGSAQGMLPSDAACFADL